MKLQTLLNPIAVTKGAFGLAGTAFGVAETVARSSAQLVVLGLRELARAADDAMGPDQSRVDGRFDDEPLPDVPEGVAVEDERLPKGPTIVAADPHPPAEPPIDVVGQALADEAARGGRTGAGAGVAHEPRGASRDEEHGGTPLERAEAEGIDEEVEEALESDEL